ncbi:enoyl-CoA hydratase [Diaphorobacter sp. HDW4A]|uniref:enoyl-CoA hydratase/isomerase family protein n=1 Tax=Diaphorobacter sp. HDW4A TaxID=2714924 RepID=UPI00140D7508|nr:enoyl-CoA hydratase-related protein [Diaphorobacter sp. HDW4A]QIL82492.1 enoyl-CoA hydratase [Diaphorobacter sp. HDW4A]
MIRSEWSDDVLEITIDRADKRNALSHSMYDELTHQIEMASAEPRCAAIILSGAGGMFTAGADIGDFQTKRNHDDSPAIRYIRALMRTDVPVIAAVEGFAIGIGSTMLQHCDFVYTTAQTRFRMPFVQLGLCPEAGSSVLLERIVGTRRAREWLLQCKPFTGSEALEAGFATALAEPGNTLMLARAAAQDLTRMPRTSLRQSKALLRNMSQAELMQTVDEEVRTFNDLLNTDDTQRIFKAFMENA